MALPAPRGRLLRRLLVATLLPAVAALAVFGILAHEVARRTLDDDLGRRLGTAAAGAALTILPEQIAELGGGDAASLTHANVTAKLAAARDRLGVRRLALVATDLTGRGDTDGRIALGAPAHELGADRAEIALAAAGRPTASPLFIGHDGKPHKRGYAAVGGPGAVAGFVVVEGSADTYAPLAAFRRWLLAGGLLALGAIVGITVLVARRMTGPLGRLAAAADRIGRGELKTAVAVETDDEIGFLASNLDEMRTALHARDERMQMMLAGIAHEVRNPLGGLELYAGLLREALAGNPERLAEIARIEREIGYLNAVVGEFLAYARRPPPEMDAVPVRPLLEEVKDLCLPPGGGPEVTIDCADGVSVGGDRGQLRRALLNLARNAVAAAGDGGRVVLAARPLDGTVELEVRDSGPGVPAELREKIFAPFFTTREKGTGLGLAFVRDIVRDHGGEIGVDVAPEGGARFGFSLSFPARRRNG